MFEWLKNLFGGGGTPPELFAMKMDECGGAGDQGILVAGTVSKGSAKAGNKVFIHTAHGVLNSRITVIQDADGQDVGQAEAGKFVHMLLAWNHSDYPSDGDVITHSEKPVNL